MFPSKALLSSILISLSIAGATPVTRSTGKATLSFTTKLNTEGPLNIVEKDLARAQALKDVSHLEKRGRGISASNAAVTYIAQVGVGSPLTNYTLLIDTGSSNTWIGADKPYVPTNTSKSTCSIFFVRYGSGEVLGEEYIDTVTLSPDLVIPQQSIGVADIAEGFDGVDGILGVGPTDLTKGTVNMNKTTIPTVTDNLLSEGKISQEVLGVYYVPFSESDSDGTLTFGGMDDSVMTSSVQYVPLTTTQPASKYWGIDQSIYYGNSEILSQTAGIVDTGTTLIYIATDAFNMYKSATGATFDENIGLFKITPAQYANLQTLSFKIGGASYNLIPNAQIWPRSLNTAIGGDTDSIYLVVNDIGSNSGSGLDFINGYTFLERFYSVFDTTNNQVGFAPTRFTESTSN